MLLSFQVLQYRHFKKSNAVSLYLDLDTTAGNSLRFIYITPQVNFLTLSVYNQPNFVVQAWSLIIFSLWIKRECLSTLTPHRTPNPLATQLGDFLRINCGNA